MVYSINPGALPYWIKLKAEPGDVAYYYDEYLDRYFVYTYKGPAVSATYEAFDDVLDLAEYLIKFYNYKEDLVFSNKNISNMLEEKLSPSCDYETEYCKNHIHCGACKYYVEPVLTCTAKPIPDIGDTIYYCYELFGEHLIQEVIVEELTINRNGLKRLHVKSINGNSSYVFEAGSAYHSLDEIAFTKEDADRWLGEKK